MVTQTKINQNEPKEDSMVTSSPYHTASITAYPELEERLAATEDPAEVLALPPKEALPARIARGFLAFYDWLSVPPMTNRDRVKEDIAKAWSEWYGRLEHAKLS